MRQEFRLGRIGGVRVAAHWSVLLVALLVAWSLGDSLLPRLAPGQPRPAYWATAAAATLLVLLSLVAHELAHAMVAEREGMRVDGMTLWLFGGVTTLRGEAPTPGAAFRIAIVGPATSFGLSGIFAAASTTGRFVGAPDLVVVAGWWLSMTNLLLAVFNLIPGAPLDGGRVLQAALWHHSKDRTRATINATRAGRAVGLALAVVGFVEALAGGGLDGWWLIFIGWFLISAARAEGEWARASRRLAGLTVADVMTQDPEIASPAETVESFLREHAMARDDSAYPVAEAADQIAGVVRMAQLRSIPPGSRQSTRLGDVAVGLDRLARTAPGEPLAQAQVSISDDDGYALVFDGARLVGILTRADIQQATSRHPAATRREWAAR